MRADANWLLSTVAQSAAALVAIIGGFLVSRVITLAAARSAFVHRLGVLDGEVNTTARLIDEHRHRLLQLDARAFVQESRDKLIATPNLPIAELIRLGDPLGHTEAELAPFIDNERSVIAEAFQTLEPLILHSNMMPDSLGDAKTQFANLRVDPEQEETWDAVFRDIRKRFLAEQRRQERVRREEEARRSPFPSLAAAAINPIDFDVELDDAFLRIPATGGVLRKEIQDRLDALEAELALRELERSKITDEISGLRQPKEVWLGIAVLIYFSILGIVWPIMVLANLEFFHSPQWRAWLVGAFTSGFLALIGFLAYSIRRMSR